MTCLRFLSPICRRFAISLLFLASVALSPATALGQSPTATLSGQVTDERGAVIPGATVTVVNTATGARRETTTNGEGYFVALLLPPSTYVFNVQQTGFAPIEVKNVVLNVGDKKSLQIQLKAGDINATVQVVNDAPLINESPAVGTTVDRQFVENIPLNGRTFQSLITLTPGVVVTPSAVINGGFGQFSVNGQRASANSFSVDGVSANYGLTAGVAPGVQTSGNLPGLTAFGTTQSLVSIDALQEFKIQTSTYAAEFGHQPGGQISLLTRSGTNQFHGSLYDYLRNDKLDANDWFANRAGIARAPERQNDFGGTFSGPVMLPRFGEGGHQPGYNGRNRTFFFFSYEGLRLRLPQFSLTNVPTLCLRGLGTCPAGQTAAPAAVQPILNAFPLPNGRDLGNGLAEFSAGYSDPASLDAASIRIDHTVNNKLTLFGRFNKAPSEAQVRAAGSNLSDFQSSKTNNRSVTVGASASLSPKTTNDFRFNYTNNSATQAVIQDSFAGAVPAPRNTLIVPQFDSPTARGATNFLMPGRTSSTFPAVNFTSSPFLAPQRQLNVVDDFAYVLGAHQLKFGIDYRRLTPIFLANSYFFRANFNTLAQVINSTAATGLVLVQREARPIYVNFSAYGQDSWRISHKLTVNFGLRWEINPAPGEANGNDPLAVTGVNNLAAMQLAPHGTKLWKTTYNNFAPRLGLAYQLRNRSGFGRQ